MAVAGSLNLIFKANTSNAIRGMKKLQRASSATMGALSKIGSVAGSIAGSIARVGLVAGGAATAMSALAVATASNARENENWAQSLALPAKRLSAMTKVAEKFGIEGDQVADAMKDLSAKITLAVKEGGGLADVFQNFGIDIGKFKGLTNDQKLFTFFDEMKKMSKDDSLTMMDEINDSMFQLSPLLQSNTKDFKTLVRQFEASDLALDNLERGSLLNLDSAFKNMTGSITILIEKVSSRLAPALTIAFDVISSQANSGLESFHGLYEGFKKMVSDMLPVFKSMREGLMFGLQPLFLAVDALKKVSSGIKAMNPLKNQGMSDMGAALDRRSAARGETKVSDSDAWFKKLEETFAKIMRPMDRIGVLDKKNPMINGKFESFLNENKSAKKGSFHESLAKSMDFSDIQSPSAKAIYDMRMAENAEKAKKKPALKKVEATSATRLSAQQINPNRMVLSSSSSASIAQKQLSAQTMTAKATQQMAKQMEMFAEMSTRSSYTDNYFTGQR